MAAKKKESNRANWSVTMRCVVTKVVTCEGCTEEESRNNPFEFATDEQETEQRDWDVERVERDE